MKRIFFALAFLILLPFQKSAAQWTGSTSNADTDNNRNDLNNYQQKTKVNVNIGSGIGGAALRKCRESLSYANGYSAFLEDDENVDLNIFMNFLQQTKIDKLWVGFEIGTSYADYYASWAINPNLTIRSGDGAEHFILGAAVQMKYNFVQTQTIDLYALGAYGIAYDIDWLEPARYGVAAIGARWSLLFAELGYNTTGFFRFGLSLNAYKK